MMREVVPRLAGNSNGLGLLAVFSQWFDFLLFVNDEQRNKELINNYFFERFAAHPQQFYHFILFFKKKLHSTRNIKIKKHLAQKYLDIISPLCERFGLFEEKYILDDLCFFITNKKKYRDIEKILSQYKKKSGKLTKTILSTLTDLILKKNYTCEVKGRYKNMYSIYRKVAKKNHRNVLQLNDIFAFRIIVKNNSIDDCFEIVNLLHDQFFPISDYFKDYITIPKINGYQSLHTGLSNVIPNLTLPIEVQIRTQSMDDFAEKGLAAHWVYAKEKKTKLVTEKEKNLINYFSYISLNAQTSQTVYFFSYTGDIFSLERGSSILDFAYSIHTHVGNKTQRALVNGKREPIYYKIQEGDRIKIVTAKENQVKPEWLPYIHTNYARKKIHEVIKRS